MLKTMVSVLRSAGDWILYYITSLLPRKKDLWVFIGWRFNKDREIFAENVKYMFLYAAQHEKKVHVVWIGQDNQLCALLRSRGFHAYPYYSFQGVWYTLRAGYVFVGALVQKHHWRLLGGCKIIQLWHGKSLKKTGYNSPYSLSRYNRFLSGNVFVKPHLFISMSQYFAQYVKTDFNIPQEKILASGLPKHDPLFRTFSGSEIDQDESMAQLIAQQQNNGTRRLILYAPTFRPSGENPLSGIDFNSLNKALSELNDHAIVTLHPKFSTKSWKPPHDLSHVTFYESTGDSYPLLSQFDLLISDYSSLVIEFLMMRKPVLLFAYDFKEYNTGMGIYTELWNIIPAKKTFTQHELEQALSCKTESAEEIDRAWNILFDFDDGCSTKRIADYVRSHEL